MARGSPPDGGGGGSGRGRGESRGALGQWKCRLLGSLRPRHPRCVVCLQVQHVTGLPPAAEGRGVVVGWRSKGGEGEHTAPARVARGAAAFDEVFLQHFTVGGATLRGFTVWAALLDAPTNNGDLGAFPVDLAEVAAAAAETSNNPRKFGGKALSFPLGGAAAGAVLTVSIYCRVMDRHEDNHGAANNGQAREKKNKGKAGSYASCLPDLSCLRNRQVAAAAASGGLARRATSIRSDRGGFITIENSVAEMDGGGGAGATLGVAEDVDEEEGAGFITMEKSRVSSRSSSRPLPPDTVEEEEEDEKPCLLMELSSEAAASAADVEKVEEEFLAMLEDRYWARSKEIEKGLGVSLDIGLDLGLDLDSLIKDAEMELAKSEQAWKSKVGAAIVEEEEYKELVRRWSARETSHHSDAAAATGCSWGFGFGSPI
ncbi:unnamed protein product [Miscanthus lutarioriparius]|uniref:C2 NT-type domain-containing protein n=1 Tax=Miscanthus lutarioriparius TaxID=422564 RepID=A0A811PEU0_9POAL|nr:unnamed protein product [Miscanthus lutarioriparius]